MKRFSLSLAGTALSMLLAAFLIAHFDGRRPAGVHAQTNCNGAQVNSPSNCFTAAAAPGATLQVSSPASDLICAKGSDTNVAALTITGATNAAPIVFTVSSSPITAGYYVGESFAVQNVTPSAYNGTYTLTALTGTTITASNGSSPGSSYSSGGSTYLPCNNSSDATGSVQKFATGVTIPANFFQSNTTARIDTQMQIFIPTANNTALGYGLFYGSTQVFSNTASIAGANVLVFQLAPTAFTDFDWRIHSPSPGVLFTTSAAGTFQGAGPSAGANILAPVAVSIASLQIVTPAIYFQKQGVATAVYQSGGSIAGTTGQSCNATFVGFSNTAATILLTENNNIDAGTSFTITNNGQGPTAGVAPTAANLTNGSATCSGQATVTGTTGGAQGMAMKLLSIRSWQQ